MKGFPERRGRLDPDRRVLIKTSQWIRLLPEAFLGVVASHAISRPLDQGPGLRRRPHSWAVAFENRLQQNRTSLLSSRPRPPLSPPPTSLTPDSRKLRLRDRPRNDPIAAARRRPCMALGHVLRRAFVGLHSAACASRFFEIFGLPESPAEPGIPANRRYRTNLETQVAERKPTKARHMTHPCAVFYQCRIGDRRRTWPGVS